MEEREVKNFCKKLNKDQWEEKLEEFKEMKLMGEGINIEVRGNDSEVLKLVNLEETFNFSI